MADGGGGMSTTQALALQTTQALTATSRAGKGGGECVKVVVRVRPLFGKEINEGREKIVTMDIPRSTAILYKPGGSERDQKEFAFDAVFDESFSQQKIFEDAAQEIVDSVMDGFNGTIFAYGQTGAGKTYTLYGGPGESRGIAPRTIEALFERLGRLDGRRFRSVVRAHLVELYKTDLLDLLAAGKGAGRLEVRRDARTGETTVDNVDEREVSSPQELLRLIDEGLEHRHIASTQLNADSSRSHLFFTVSIDVFDREANTSVGGKLRLCDLAGSERAKKSGASGEAMKEAIEINRALTALGDVIEALTRAGAVRGPVPYRNHKLTTLLSDSLGGTAKTLMIVNVSPARSEVEETLNSLAYASRVKSITNDVRGPQTSSHAGG
mmetsp:Transcript_26451/g.76347  ORF Transcript_26451/g.76347 Transcript_26451/m.76347 type:complete len:382 (+) Transcript_26451:96-1241(+)